MAVASYLVYQHEHDVEPPIVLSNKVSSVFPKMKNSSWYTTKQQSPVFFSKCFFNNLKDHFDQLESCM